MSLSIRECVLIDIRAAGAMLTCEFPDESATPGWLPARLKNLCVWFISPGIAPRLREAARTLFPTVLALYPDAEGDATQATVFRHALADTLAMAGLDNPDAGPVALPTPSPLLATRPAAH